MHINFLFLAALIVWLQFANARTLAEPPAPTANTTKAASSINATTASAADTLEAQERRYVAVTASLKYEQFKSEASAVRHIVRKKRELEVSMPFDFNTKHLPCDLDFSGRDSAIDSYPNHCIWVWNNRYTHEGWYRVYKTYQLEAFFFGQYYERLKRYEIDPHTWDYDNTEIN